MSVLQVVAISIGYTVSFLGIISRSISYSKDDDGNIQEKKLWFHLLLQAGFLTLVFILIFILTEYFPR